MFFAFWKFWSNLVRAWSWNEPLLPNSNPFLCKVSQLPRSQCCASLSASVLLSLFLRRVCPPQIFWPTWVKMENVFQFDGTFPVHQLPTTQNFISFGRALRDRLHRIALSWYPNQDWTSSGSSNMLTTSSFRQATVRYFRFSSGRTRLTKTKDEASYCWLSSSVSAVGSAEIPHTKGSASSGSSKLLIAFRILSWLLKLTAKLKKVNSI